MSAEKESNFRILVVDDNSTSLALNSHLATKVIKDLKLSENIDVIKAESTNEAIQKFKSLPGNINLIITDCEMPQDKGGNGDILIKRLRGEEGYKGVIVANSSEEKYSEMLITAGANAFIKKPITKQALTDALERELSKLKTQGVAESSSSGLHVRRLSKDRSTQLDTGRSSSPVQQMLISTRGRSMSSGGGSELPRSLVGIRNAKETEGQIRR